ncbi:hypothetical protein [Ekhidna sp.]|uniref:hypothetical protein n=1 Tax=Ekhidna sp. TaxID=2608089 RepID=UPI003C7A07CD
MVDIIAGVIVVLVIGMLFFLLTRERERVGKLMDESVGEKYMQLLSIFMKKDGASLTDMSSNKADVKIITDNNVEENFSIIQSHESVNVYWSLTNKTEKVDREFKFNSEESQDDIINVILPEIIKAERELQ